MLELNIIKESRSVYASPCFAIKKANGELRLVIDYRKLNSITCNDPFPLPTLDELYTQLQSSCVFSRLDMRNGYYQIAISAEDRYKSAFVTPYGHYEFIRMPFGLTTAPRTFQRAIQNIFNEHNNVLIFLDDLLVHNLTAEEHLISLKQIFILLEENNILLNLDKCLFFTKEVKYLGNIIGNGNIRLDNNDLLKLKTTSTPKTTRQLQKFIGAVNWFRPFVPQLSETLSPLNEKLREPRFSWSKEDERNFNAVFETLEKTCELAIPCFNQPFKLFTDASSIGISALLVQNNGLVRLFSAKLSNSERGYSAIEREMLAIIKGMLSFRKLIWNAKTYIYTDNANITYSSPIFNSRIQRWKLCLQEFKFTLIHIEGKEIPEQIYFQEYTKPPRFLRKKKVKKISLSRQIKFPKFHN